MIPLSPARRAAEEFASLVDGTRGETSERYADLLNFVDVLRHQQAPAPRADFTADLRTRLMDAADTLLVPSDQPARLAPVVSLDDAAKRRQRRIGAVAAAFVVVGGTAGVAAASSNALPGDPLYPLKRGIEQAKVSLNTSDAARGQDLLAQGSTRLAEVGELIAADQSASEIETTLEAFSDSATAGAEKYFIAFQRDRNAEDIARLRAQLATQLTTLEELAANAPARSQGAFDAARALLTDLDDQARALCNCDLSSPDLSSGSGLTSLLVGPAYQASGAAGGADVDPELAKAAEEFLKNNPQADPTKPAPQPGTGNGGAATDGVTGKNPVGEVVDGVNEGVTSLLREVSAATGGALDPLVNLVDDTLNKVGETVNPQQ